MFVHYKGYTLTKISRFVTLETIFSIMLSIFIGYYFYNENLNKNEFIGIGFSVLSIMSFYYQEIQEIYKNNFK